MKDFLPIIYGVLVQITSGLIMIWMHVPDYWVGAISMYLFFAVSCRPIFKHYINSN
jgi:ABC-type dipeptide/oligopeptide/nickel transport system permease component